MKKLLFSLLLTFSLVSALWAEIVITQRVEGGGANGEMTLSVKGKKIRMDMPQQLSILMDTATGDIALLHHAQKMAMPMTGETIKQMLQLAGDLTAPKYTPTGKSEEVEGYKTEVYTSEQAVAGTKIEATYWVAKDYPNKELHDKVLKLMEQSALAEMVKGASSLPGVAVKTVTKGGQEGDTTITLVSIREAELDDALFNAPKEYQTFQMPSIPQAQ